MSFRDCIENGTTEESVPGRKKITRAQAEEAKKTLEQYKLQFVRDGHGESVAEDMAARATFAKLQADAKHKKVVASLQAKIYSDNIEKITRHVARDGGERPGAAVAAFIQRDATSTYSDLYYRERVIQKKAFSFMYKILSRHHLGFAGQVRHKAELRDLVRAAFGEETNEAAKQTVQGWVQAHEYLRLRANAAGMRIAKLENWGMPTRHQAHRISEAGFDRWRKRILENDWIDWGGMINERTGLHYGEFDREFALRSAYDNIIADGRGEDLAPRSALHNRRGDHRFFKFKSADAWMAYQKAYGDDNSYEAMLGHIKSMSRDIAELEILGPSPTAMRAALRAFAERRAIRLDEGHGTAQRERLQPKVAELENKFGTDAEGLDDAIDELYRKAGIRQPFVQKAARDLDKADDLYLNWRQPGRFRSMRWATFFATTRNLMSGSLLGSAPVSAIGDIATLRVTHLMQGVPATRMIIPLVKGLLPFEKTRQRELLARTGLVVDSWIEQNSQMARFFGDGSGSAISQRVSDSALKLYGLNAWTENARAVQSKQTMGMLADNSRFTWPELGPVEKQHFERYGVDAERWERIRHTPLETHSGATWLIPDRIADPELRNIVSEMVLRETDLAVPTVSLRARTLMLGSTKAGTYTGDLLRNMALFKSFGVTVFVENLARYASVSGGRFTRAKYLANFLVGATIMGALALQIKALIAGRDFRDMTDARFWAASMLQGGAFGIIGDFLWTNESRMGGGIGQTIAGPIAGLATDTWDLTAGNVAQVVTGDRTNLPSELVDYGLRYAPGSHPWYGALIMERLFYEQLRKAADPRAERRRQQRLARYARKYGHDHWWRPGESAPRRWPNPDTAMGTI